MLAERGVERGGFVAYVHESYIPEITAYSLSGDILWRTVVDGYVPPDYEEFSDGVVSVNFPKNGAHKLASISILPNNNLIVQLALITTTSRDRRDEYAELHSLVLNGLTGEGAQFHINISPIVTANSASIVTASMNPFPQLHMYRWNFAGYAGVERDQ